MYLNINPTFLSLGPFQIQWYGLMYVVAFGTFYALIRWRIAKKEVHLTKEQLLDFLTYAIVGLLLGGRLGYAVFYNFAYFLAYPVQLVWPFINGQFVGIAGMSFHGGLIGVVIATLLFIRKHRLVFWQFTDAVLPAIPLAYTWGRLGNFLNGELWGKPTDLPIGLVFPADLLGVPRHPSQLYEAFLEGIVIFLILWPIRNKEKYRGRFIGLYLILYALARFLVEFVREPDRQLGYLALGLTMGQLLSIGMFVMGLFLLYKNRTRI